MGDYLVTGARGGMGRAVCERLTQAGCRVYGVDVKTGAEENWPCLRADLTAPGEIEGALEEIRAQTQGMDGVIHTAGIYDLNSLAEMPEEDFIRDFRVNVLGAYRIVKLSLPLLKKGGRVVIVTSELAPLPPLPFTGIYAATKAAEEKYALSLQMELQLLGRRVIVVRPGAVDTPLLPASTERLCSFCENTKLYPCNADRFRRIVDRVEARSIPPEKIAKLIFRALQAKRPRPVYNVNRNPWLLGMRWIPARLRLYLIRKILSDGGKKER